MPKSTAILGPNLGLYYGLDPLLVPSRAVQDGRNFRIQNGRLSNINMGWQPRAGVDFEHPVTLIEEFRRRNGTSKTIVGTTRDLFDYDVAADTAMFLNPIYSSGTVTVGVGTNFGLLLALVTAGTSSLVSVASGTPNWVTNGIKAGDYIHFGSASQRDPSATWYRIASVPGENLLNLAEPVLEAVSGLAYTIRRTFIGSISTPWDTATFVQPNDGTGDDLWFGTNGVDAVVTWDGDAAEVTRQTSLGFTCTSIAVYKNMMIYGGIVDNSGDEKPLSIINSDIGKPLDVSAGLSEEFRVHDGTYPIRAMLPLGDNLVIYTERQIILAQFVGDPVVFAFREAGTGVGPLANRLVADFGDYHEFVGADCQYLFDGVTSTAVNEQVWREVLRQRDASRILNAFHHFDEERGEVIWSIPLTSDAGVGDATMASAEAFVEHYLEEVGAQTPTPFSRRDFPFTAAGSGVVATSLTWDAIAETWDQMVIRWNDSFLFAAFPTMLAGGSTGTLFEVNTIQTGNGAFLPSYVHFGRRPTVDGIERGLVPRIYPFSDDLNGTLDITLLLSDHAAGPPTITDTQTFDSTLLEGRFFTSHYRAGRYFEVKMGNSGGAWQVSGYDVDVRNGGRR